MKCPGCSVVAPWRSFPAALDPIEDQPSDDPWWCRSCLTAALLAHHDDHCRCGDCRPDHKRGAA